MFKKNVILSCSILFTTQTFKPFHPFVGFKIAKAISESTTIAKKNFKDKVEQTKNNHHEQQHDKNIKEQIHQAIEQIQFDQDDIINICLLSAL